MSIEHEGNPLWLDKEGDTDEYELDEKGNIIKKKKKQIIYGNETLEDVNEKKEEYKKNVLNE